MSYPFVFLNNKICLKYAILSNILTGRWTEQKLRLLQKEADKINIFISAKSNLVTPKLKGLMILPVLWNRLDLGYPWSFKLKATANRPNIHFQGDNLSKFKIMRFDFILNSRFCRIITQRKTDFTWKIMILYLLVAYSRCNFLL